MELASGFRTLASGTTVYFEDGHPLSTSPCAWAVQVPSGNPEPDFIEDTYVIEDCGAPAVYFEAGGFRCEAGHSLGSLEEELGPFGNEWAREQEERF